MKNLIETLLSQALAALPETLVGAAQRDIDIEVERTRDSSHGDFASNVAGFINFFLHDDSYRTEIGRILALGDSYGRSTSGRGKSALVEFVSANPTGPLHVGHGRGAAYGATVANLLEAVGYRVAREYYVNDAGRQMEILAASTWLRYLEQCGERFDFPANGYRGDYLLAIAGERHSSENPRRSSRAFRPTSRRAGTKKRTSMPSSCARAGCSATRRSAACSITP